MQGEYHASQNFLNKEVQIYWKSQSCNHISDCLPVYKAVIKRVDHDYDNVKIMVIDTREGEYNYKKKKYIKFKTPKITKKNSF